MEGPTGGRERGIALAVFGVIILVLGAIGITGLWCSTGFYNCPAAGCTFGPATCPSPFDYVFSAALVVVGACMTALGGLLARRSKNM